MEIKQALTNEDFRKCFPVMHALRPHLTESSFIELLKEMKPQGYTLIYAEVNGQAVSCCGYRHQTMFFDGRQIYIDDLSTLPEGRGKGYGSALLNVVKEEAAAAGCVHVHLDSGHHRFDAHRLYLNQGYRIIAHHFIQPV